MKLPSEEQSIEWAKAEALQLPNKVTPMRKHLLILLSIIQRLEAQVHELRAKSEEKKLEHHDQTND